MRLQLHHPALGIGFQRGGEQTVALLCFVGRKAAEGAVQPSQLTYKKPNSKIEPVITGYKGFCPTTRRAQACSRPTDWV